jgi:hypothetical protein
MEVDEPSVRLTTLACPTIMYSVHFAKEHQSPGVTSDVYSSFSQSNAAITLCHPE